MKYEDLVWDIVEGSTYLETSFTLNGQLIKIVKLDDDSFRVYADGRMIKEVDLFILSEQLSANDLDVKIQSDMPVDAADLLRETERMIAETELLNQTMVYKGVSEWKNSKWDIHPKHGYPYLEIKSNRSNLTLQILKLDEDSFKIRGVEANQNSENINWNEWGKDQIIMSVAYEMGLDGSQFLEILKKQEESSEIKYTEDVSHTEE